MNVAETILVFVGIPLAFVLLLALLIFLPGGRKRPRYKSGQAWEHAPVWYEPHPEHSPAAAHGSPGHDGQTKAIGSSVYGEPTDTVLGARLLRPGRERRRHRAPQGVGRPARRRAWDLVRDAS